MAKAPDLVLIGDGRLAGHLAHYFKQLGVSHVQWSRRAHAEGRAPDLEGLVHSHTRALLAISDRAIEPFVSAHPELAGVSRIHFSGGLLSPLAIGAHPLFSFASTFYERELYERIPFVMDNGSLPLSALIPGLPNPSFFIEPGRRARYHALCVLAGNFTTLLWRKFFFELDSEFGIAREHAFPYLDSITSGLKGQGAPLSGPLCRDDQITIQRNLKSLKGDPFEDVYKAFVTAYQRQGKLAAGQGGKDWLIP
jgi:predicted short-subunit dehydrogenase-like oxidoreductase (DUF2520 family)